MKFSHLIRPATAALFLAMFLGFGATTYAAVMAGEASLAIVPLLNCILALVLLIHMARQRWFTRSTMERNSKLT